MEGGKEPNYWPGFVDALSNVVLTLVFVLVIFVFALMMSANKVEKKMEDAIKAEKARNEEQGELDKALTELNQIRSQETTSKSGAAAGQEACLRFSKSDNTQKTEADPATDSLLIFFGVNAISITDDTSKAIHDFIDAYRAKNGNGHAKFVIEAPEDPTSVSPLMARETQLGRMLNTRNSLLSGKVDPPDISIHNVAPLQQKGGYDWIKIHVEK